MAHEFQDVLPRNLVYEGLTACGAKQRIEGIAVGEISALLAVGLGEEVNICRDKPGGLPRILMIDGNVSFHNVGSLSGFS
jgi:hypothetical protein